MTQGTGTWKSNEQPGCLGCSTSDLDFAAAYVYPSSAAFGLHLSRRPRSLGLGSTASPCPLFLFKKKHPQRMHKMLTLAVVLAVP